nr:hypothetical protein CFP56_70425 [Quercus suber]
MIRERYFTASPALSLNLRHTYMVLESPTSSFQNHVVRPPGSQPWPPLEHPQEHHPWPQRQEHSFPSQQQGYRLLQQMQEFKPEQSQLGYRLQQAHSQHYRRVDNGGDFYGYRSAPYPVPATQAAAAPYNHISLVGLESSNIPQNFGAFSHIPVTAARQHSPFASAHNPWLDIGVSRISSNLSSSQRQQMSNALPTLSSPLQNPDAPALVLAFAPHAHHYGNHVDNGDLSQHETFMSHARAATAPRDHFTGRQQYRSSHLTFDRGANQAAPSLDFQHSVHDHQHNHSSQKNIRPTHGPTAESRTPPNMSQQLQQPQACQETAESYNSFFADAIMQIPSSIDKVTHTSNADGKARWVAASQALERLFVAKFYVHHHDCPAALQALNILRKVKAENKIDTWRFYVGMYRVFYCTKTLAIFLLDFVAFMPRSYKALNSKSALNHEIQKQIEHELTARCPNRRTDPDAETRVALELIRLVVRDPHCFKVPDISNLTDHTAPKSRQSERDQNAKPSEIQEVVQLDDSFDKGITESTHNT